MQRFELDIIAYTAPEPGKKMGRPVRFDDATADHVFLMLWEEGRKKELLAVEVTELYSVDEGKTLRAICTVLQGQMNHAVHNAYHQGRVVESPEAEELRQAMRNFLKL